MFDIAFSELLVIAVVALLVIGPEKLPKVARTVGMFAGKLQRYVAQVKEEVNREARFEELQKLQQEIKQSVENGFVDKVVKPIEQETAALQASIYALSGYAEIKTRNITAKPAAKKSVKTDTKPATTVAKKVSKPKPAKAKPSIAKPSKAKPSKAKPSELKLSKVKSS